MGSRDPSGAAKPRPLFRAAQPVRRKLRVSPGARTERRFSLKLFWAQGSLSAGSGCPSSLHILGTLREFRGCSRCWEWSLIFILGRIEVSSCSVGQRTLLGNREVKWPDSVSLRRQAKAAPERSSVQLRGRTAAQTSASGLAPPRVLHVKGCTPAVINHMSCSQLPM